MNLGRFYSTLLTLTRLKTCFHQCPYSHIPFNILNFFCDWASKTINPIISNTKKVILLIRFNPDSLIKVFFIRTNNIRTYEILAYVNHSVPQGQLSVILSCPLLPVLKGFHCIAILIGFMNFSVPIKNA